MLLKMTLSVLLNYVLFLLNSNEPTNVAHLQKLANQSMLHGSLVVEMINSSFNEKKKKIEISAVKNIFY